MKVHPSSLKLPISSSNLFMNHVYEYFVSASTTVNAVGLTPLLPSLPTTVNICLGYSSFK